MSNLKIEKTCSRCNRAELVTVTDLAAADADNKASQKRSANWEKIKAFVNSIPVAERPMSMVFLGDKSISHNHLCSGDGPKTNCQGRVSSLLDGVNTLPPRKPRAKKGEAAAAAPTTTPPAAASASTPAAPAHDDKHPKDGKKK